jgi:hypothetical protein
MSAVEKTSENGSDVPNGKLSLQLAGKSSAPAKGKGKGKGKAKRKAAEAAEEEEEADEGDDGEQAESSSGKKRRGRTRPAPFTVDGKKRYPCGHPGCNKTFSTSGHAARHSRIHAGE